MIYFPIVGIIQGVGENLFGCLTYAVKWMLPLSLILYYGCGVGGLKTIQKIAKILIIASIIFLIVAYITYLGFDIPIISDLLNSINI